VLSQATGPPAAGHDPLATVSEIARLVRRSVRTAAPSSVLVGIGVSVPGIIARNVGVVRLAPNLDWHDVPLADLLSDELPSSWRPVLGNDADHGALAEHLRGVGRGVDDLVYISGEVGVGAGVIAGGRPISGASGFAGEIGHVPFGEGARQCHCGSTGCWETEVGAARIAAAIGCPPDQLADLDRYLEELSIAPGEFATIGRHLGRGLAGLVNLLNPRMVIMGGYLRSLYRWVERDVEAEMAARALRIPGMAPRIAVPGLGDRPVLIGASEVAFRALLDDPAGHMMAAQRTAGSLVTRKAR
jgi:predicted NBD/HSP70 family sugar kinase